MKKNSTLILAVFALALVVRLFYLYDHVSSPLFSSPVLDEQSLDMQGQDVAAGNILAGTVGFRAPLYPLFLGSIYSMGLEQRFFVVKVVQHILGALTCVLLFILAAAAFDRMAGLASSLLAAIYGPFIFFEGTILIESLFVFLTVLCLTLLILAAKKDDDYLMFAGGFALALCAIARPNILPFVPAVFLWALLLPAASDLGFRRFARAGIVMLPVVAIVGAISIHNYMVSGEFVLVSSQGGVNFYLGNNLSADGLPPPARMVYNSTTRYKDAVEASSTETVAGLLSRPASPAQVSGICYKAALVQISAHPTRWIALMARKFVFFWNDFEIPNVKNYYFWKELSPLLTVLPLSYGIIAALGLMGMLIAIVTGLTRSTTILLLFVLTFMGGILMFFVCARLRLPVLAGLFPFAGGAVSWIATTLRGRQFRRLTLAVVPVVLIFLFVFIDWYGIKSFNFAQDYWLVGRRYYDLRSYDKAAECFRSSMQYDGGFPGNHIFLGNCLLQEGKVDAAIASYQSALDIDPSNTGAMNALGVCAERKHDKEKAEAIYRKVIATNPEYAKARTNLGMLLIGARRFEQAKLMLDSAINLTDSDPETWFGLALYEHFAGNASMSGKYLMKAQSLGDQDYKSLFEKTLSDPDGSR